MTAMRPTRSPLHEALNLFWEILKYKVKNLPRGLIACQTIEVRFIISISFFSFHLLWPKSDIYVSSTWRRKCVRRTWSSTWERIQLKKKKKGLQKEEFQPKKISKFRRKRKDSVFCSFTSSNQNRRKKQKEKVVFHLIVLEIRVLQLYWVKLPKNSVKSFLLPI